MDHLEERPDPLKPYRQHLRMFTVFLKDGGYAKTTIKEYILDVNMFLEGLEATPLENVTDFDVRDFLSKVRESGNNERTRNRKLSSIRKFFDVMVEMRALEENPTGKIKGAKQEKNSLPVYLEDHELLAFLESIPGGKFHTRNMAVFMLMAYGGLRVSEVHNLSLEGINRSRNTLNVLGKGNKWRLVPISPSVMNILTKVERERKPKDPSENALFISQFGRRLSIREIQNICKAVWERLSQDEKFSYLRGKKFSCHKLRHTFGTRNVRSGNDIRVIQQLMGHASLNTTQIYTHVADEQLEKAIANVPVMMPNSVDDEDNETQK